MLNSSWCDARHANQVTTSSTMPSMMRRVTIRSQPAAGYHRTLLYGPKGVKISGLRIHVLGPRIGGFGFT